LFELRRESKVGNGVYLGTMHSAKGMEFNHVLIPDGGWTVKSNDKTIEDERRLFYVAMTRARKNLSVFSVKNTPNPHIHLLDEADWQINQLTESDNQQAKLANYKYELISLADTHLGYPGRFNKGSKIHLDLSNLRPGDIVYLKMENDSILIQNQQGKIISKLAKSALKKWSEKLPNIKQGVINLIN